MTDHTPSSPLRRAFLKIEELEARLEELSAARAEPLALVGMACRFPGNADTPQALWELLAAGRDATGEMPGGRWNTAECFDPRPGVPGKMYTTRGGFLDPVDRFDAAFFGISPREAAQLDPQQRLLLETAWEALEHAGIAPAGLRGSLTGVYVGMATYDYAHLQIKSGDPARCDAYYGTGTAASIASGRIAYTLGLHGPAISIDTACSSSLVALHLACRALRNRDCDLALVGGVNLILSPEAVIAMCQSRMMAPDGRCKTFDAAADGFGQAEGCAVVVVKRLSEAQRDGDRILALIRGTAINQDGASTGLTAPNGPAQEAVARAALADARLEPGDVGYVEAHGTGTTLGDPIEVQALAAVFGLGRAPEEPLWIGSVKTNLGHLEAAAGLAGLLKVVLALQHAQIPAHLHFKNPNPLIPWEEIPVRVADRLLPFPRSHGRRVAGLSSFGFSGTNAHVIVEEAPPIASPAGTATERPLHILTLGARSDQALRALTERYQAWLRSNPEERLADVAFSANTGRSPAASRIAVVAPDLPTVDAALAAFNAGKSHPALQSAALNTPEPLRVAFIFAGEWSRDSAAVCQSLAAEPHFKEAYEQCAALFARYMPGPLQGDQALFALEWALLALWRSWGIEPALVMGMGVGDIVAACAAGVFTLPDAIRLLQGDAPSTPLKDPAITLLSSVTGRPFLKGEASRLENWSSQSRAARPIANPLKSARELGYHTFLTIPDMAPVLPVGCDFLPSLREAEEAWPALLKTLAHLYLRGVPVNWTGFDRPYARRKLSLPTYPFQRERYWIDEVVPAAAPSQAAPEALDDCFYEVRWNSAPLAEEHGFSDADSFLIIGEARTIAEQLAARLRALGAKAACLPAEASGRVEPGGASGVTGVIFLDLIDHRAGDPVTEVEHACRPLLSLVQSLANQSLHPPPRLWIVTAGSQSVAPDDAIPGLPGSALWGMAKVIALEHPEFHPVRIDLDSKAGIENLLAELAQPPVEPLVAYRAGERFVSRIARLPQDVATSPLVLAGDTTCMVTGGLSGLGLAVAEWLVARGARNLLLMGRRLPSAEAEKSLEAMRASGARIITAQADVTSEPAMRALFEGPLRALPRLRGVIHCAGRLEEGHALLRQDWPDFARMLAPKVTGAWLLHQFSESSPLDFFVLFSSASTLLGVHGQAHYAAANAFLDGIAHWRRARGLPAQSIDWGAWGSIGAAARADIGEELARHGSGLLAPAEGLAALERVLLRNWPQTAVMRADWSRLAALLPHPAERKFFEHLAPETAPASGPAELSSAARELLDAPPENRRKLLLDHVRAHFGAVMGLPQVQVLDNQPLRDMGLDSLMAVELCHRLRAALSIGQALSPTIFFDHPSVAAVGDYLAQEIFGWTGPQSSAKDPDAIDRIEQMSDEEVDRLLSRRLEKAF